jgi:SAM-dependent methyltransferase
MTEYQIVRQKEGRGSDAAEYYLALPFRDITGRNQSQWTIRARTYRYLEEKLLPRLERKSSEGMDVLDLGAGNGWLSYRLALRGHRPVAVDLLVNDTDGLGAAAHYRDALGGLFPRFQAELDRLPFADSQFDCAIFNASFHYSEDYIQTLREAIRCLRPGGSVIVCDSPWYADERSGQQMLEERRAAFIARFGFPSDGMASMEFLTDRILMRLERHFDIRWRVQTPFYGIRWSMRPWMAKLRREREPSRFRIYVAEVMK